MKPPLTLVALLGAALLSLTVAHTILPAPASYSATGHYSLEVELTSNATGFAQCYFAGEGDFNEANSVRLPVAHAHVPAALRFPLPIGTLRQLRLDPLDGEAVVRLENALIRHPFGWPVKKFSPADFRAAHQIATLSTAGKVLTAGTTTGATDPSLLLDLGSGGVDLQVRAWDYARFTLVRSAPVFGLLLLLTWLLGRLRLPALLPGAWARAQTRPQSVVAAAAALAVIISSYPVIFCGASFVSPNYGSTLLYGSFPTLPGSTATAVIDVRGADIGAVMWQQVPESFIQARALFRDLELPLWNRYNSGGTVLLGQGQTMFGDPLHFGVILAGGAAWAWDLKYLIAKWLLGLGLGLTVWKLTRHLAASVLVAFASIFAGFFLFRVNHPSFFSFCYGPLVLLAWSHVVATTTRRGLYLSLLGLAGANAMLLTSGTAKEAYISLLTLNLAGTLMLLVSAHPGRERLVRLAGAAAAGGVVLLVTSPVWLTFLGAMRASYSNYNAGFAFQLQPGLALGLFDELLLRPFWQDEGVFNPSTNFLILLGVLAFLVNLREITARHRSALGLGLATLPIAAFVFGLVPPAWIASWPFLGNVHHIDNSFGIGLLHLLAVLAGFGFASAARRLGGPEGRGDLAVAGLLLGALVLAYIGFTQVVQRSTYTYHQWGQSVPLSNFTWAGFLALLLGSTGLAFAVRRMLRTGRAGAALLLATAACATLLLWRHGLHLRTLYPLHTLNAAPRVDFSAPSPALQSLAADAREPGRAAGFHSHFFPGWHDVYDLEGVSGADALINPWMRELQDAFGVERAWDWRLLLRPETLPRDRPFYDLLNVRHFLGAAADPAPAGDALTLLTRADLAVWRNETAWPRAFFTDRVAPYSTASDFAALVRSGDRRPFAAVQTSDRTLPVLPHGELAGRTVVPASAYQLTTNTTSFTVDAPSAGVIVLGEAWLTGDFTATVNGRPADLFRVNHAFKGLAVPQSGTYTVIVRYRPRLFNLSLGLAALGLVFAGGMGVWVSRRFRAETAPTA